MGKFCKLLVAWFLRSLVLRVRHSVLPLLCGLLLLFGADCSLSMSDLRYDNPHADVVYICDKPLDVPPQVNLWAFNSETGELVTGEDPLALRLFAANADLFFEYDPNAPRSSISKMPPEYGLTCVKPTMAFADASAVFFRPSSELFRSNCPAKVAETVGHGDRRLLAQTTGAKPSCDTPVQQKKQAKKNPRLRVPVCVRPPGVPAPDKDGKGGAAEWGIFLKGKENRWTTSTSDYAHEVETADIIFYFSRDAPAESVYYFTPDPKKPKLRCENKQKLKPYDQVVGSKDLPMLAEVTAARQAQGDPKQDGGQTTTMPPTTSTPKKGDGQTTETSSPDGKGPPLTFAESLARNLQYVAALTAGDTSGNAKDQNGSRYGALGGKNVGGPDLLILQAAAGTFAIIQNPLKTGKRFIEEVTTAVGQKKVAVILDPKVLSKEIAEKLAKEPTEAEVEAALKGGIVESYGKALAKSLHEAQVILPYSRAEIFTLGWGGKYQAHHLIEVNMFERLGKKELAKDSPAIILTKELHEHISRELTKARKELLSTLEPDKPPSPAQVWAMYQKVYKKYPTWLEAIKHYFEP